jgi:prephenate dehydrogenase
MTPLHRDLADAKFSTIAVVGVGLIGGSIALAAKRRGVVRHVIGIGRSSARLEAARSGGLIDAASTSFDAARDADLVVVCTPVDRIADDVRAVAARLRPGALITDAGSVKVAICRELATGVPDGLVFVGAHPLAGSEKSGWEHADPDLFEGRVCVVTPRDDGPRDAVGRVESFWRELGMDVVRMTPEEHDRVVAFTSHLPHVAASALASLLAESNGQLAATGFRDTTRIAAGDPDLWTAICLENSEPVGEQIGLLIERLAEYHRAIAGQDADALRRLLRVAKERRNALDRSPEKP